MTDYVVRDTQLTSVADAIRAKGGTSDPLAFPDGFVSAVEAIPIGGGPVSVPAKEVNFRDYDGRVVYSYTPAEFAALTAMPDNPDHSGDEIPLTAQGWNWSFADAQAYVAEYGRLEVGQMYATTDGKTHVLIHLEQGRTSPILCCCPNGTVDVDWGDGTAHDTLTGTSVSTVKWTPKHEYAVPGDYDIKLTATGTMGFYGSSSSNQFSGLLRYASGGDSRNNAYRSAIRAVYCSHNVNSTVGQYAFSHCYNLTHITLPKGINTINTYAFQYCRNLRSIVIPDSVTTINSYTFYNCYGLSSITIPNSVTIIPVYMAYYCYSLSSVTIPASVTRIRKGSFSYCNSLHNITIPDNVTSIENEVFNYCYSLHNITIPDNVTSIDDDVFKNCASLSSVTIPDSVTSIGGSAFINCYSLAELHFQPTTPPTVAASNAFSNLPTDCKIYVPTGSLEAYTSATNYPSSATYTYIEE